MKVLMVAHEAKRGSLPLYKIMQISCIASTWCNHKDCTQEISAGQDANFQFSSLLTQMGTKVFNYVALVDFPRVQSEWIKFW